jgi:hypothetical protein
MLNRDGLSILLHPGTGDAYADHIDHAVWLGSVLPLRTNVLRKSRKAPHSLRVCPKTSGGITEFSEHEAD